MRGLVLVIAGALAAGGCGSLGGNADVAAEAGGQTLRAEQVAAILERVQGQRPNPDIGDFVANLWVDLTLMAQAIATEGIPSDSAAVADALWFDLAQARIAAWHDTLMARRVAVTDAQVREFHDSGDARIFQHILLPAGTTAADTAQARTTMRQIQAGLRSGQTFASIAEQHNPDATRQDGGFLPPTPRGGFVQPFDSVAWTLSPGQTSDVVETQYGWHLIRRPTFEESAPRLQGAMIEMAKRTADSAFSAELMTGREIKASNSAPAAIRTVLGDINKGKSSTRTIVTYAGGEMTAGDFARWISALPPGFPQRLREESDSALKNFAEVLTQNIVMLQQADSAGIPVPAGSWQGMQLTYRVSIDQMATELGLNGPEFGDSATTTPAQRAQLASERVNDYILKLASGEAQRRQMLPGMAAKLREKTAHRVNPAGVARAVELAIAKFVADSTAAGGAAGIPPGAVTPAPGPPPIPGGGQ